MAYTVVRHCPQLLNGRAQQNLNRFQAWPSSLDHTCFQGPEAKNNPGASKMGHEPGSGGAAGPLLSPTGGSYKALQAQNPPPQASLWLCHPPPSEVCSVPFPLIPKVILGIQKQVRFYGVLFKKQNKTVHRDSGDLVPNFSASTKMLKCHSKSHPTSSSWLFPHLRSRDTWFH